jgi:GT2 family glycosyltransferase
MSPNKVTLVVVPRERFSYTQKSLESIYANTPYPFDLVYVDGGSPKKTRDYLQAAAQQYGFKLIRTNHYLSPNQARNIGLRHVETDYVVFLDNDVLIFQPEWLETLINCGDRTGASIVVPMTLEGEACDTIHQVGGEILLKNLDDGRRWLVERRPYMHRPLEKFQDVIVPEPTQLGEFHCIFARRDLFDDVGLLDEKLLSMAEETDFCLAALQANRQVYLEPNCKVSYVPPYHMIWSDLPFFFMRWSESWCQSSVDRMIEKYNLSLDSPILRHYKVFVYDHRLIAFGGPELRLKSLIFSGGLSLSKKARHFLKKTLRHHMDRRAKAFQNTFRLT